MVVKLVTFFSLVAAATAVVVQQGPSEAYAKDPEAYSQAPVAYAQAPVAYAQAPAATKLLYEEQDTPAQYEYEYAIQDPQSGDDKSAKENRNGDVVQGYYTFVQPDGVRRIVEYTSSKEHGFNAVVRYEGAPVATKVVPQAPVTYAAAPVATKVITQAPVAYAAAPVARVSYAPAPATQVAYAQAPATVTYAQPVSYAPAPAQRIEYAPAPAPVTYAQVAQPIAKFAYAQGPVLHAQPVAKVAYPSAQVAYAQPLAKVAYAPAPAQVTYAQAPVAYAQPVGKITYSPAPSVGHFSFASPVVSYKH